MASAKKCDRCGDFYEERVIDCKASGGGSVRPLNGTLRVYEYCTNCGFYYDLCPTCFKVLMNFLRIEEVKKESDKK